MNNYFTSQWKQQLAFVVALFIVWLEHVKAFSIQAYERSSRAFSNIDSNHAARLIKSGSCSLLRSCSFSSIRVDSKLRMGMKRVSSSLKNSRSNLSFPSMENLSSMSLGNSSFGSSLLNTQRVFGSWYHEVDYRNSPVYNDQEFVGDYPSSAASTDFLPSLSDWLLEEYITSPDVRAEPSKLNDRRFRPFRMVRKAANWAFGFGLGEVEKTSF